MTTDLTDYHFMNSEVRKIMIKHSKQSFVLFDPSKKESKMIDSKNVFSG